jgi:hypothetical protein
MKLISHVIYDLVSYCREFYIPLIANVTFSGWRFTVEQQNEVLRVGRCNSLASNW